VFRCKLLEEHLELEGMCEKLQRFSVEGAELDRAKVDHNADREGTSLRDAALALGIPATDFDRIVRSQTMVGDRRRDLGLNGTT